MELKLPVRRTERLVRSPLTLVVCQVRHEHSLAVADTKRALAVHASIRESYPLLQEHAAQEIGISAGPLGVQSVRSDPARGWRMQSQDTQWTAVLMPEYFALETTAYLSWSDFRERLSALMDAVVQSIEPVLEQRIGLRMIDRIVRPDVSKPQDWKGWIEDSLLGALVHPILGPGIMAGQQGLQYDAGEGRTVLLRQGCGQDMNRPGEWPYILDYDCFVQRGIQLSATAVLDELDALHDLATRLFQSSITQDLYDSFGPSDA